MATVHVLPRNDLVAHDADETCVCGPLIDPVLDDDERVAGFIVIHAALDGRDHADGIRTEVTS